MALTGGSGLLHPAREQPLVPAGIVNRAPVHVPSGTAGCSPAQGGCSCHGLGSCCMSYAPYVSDMLAVGIRVHAAPSEWISLRQ
jgi:hypothetical protein